MNGSSLLECVERGPQDADAAIVWLHGLGADGHDFVPIVPELGLPPALKLRFVFPHARQRPVTVNGGMRMRAWYDIVSLETRRDDEAGIRDSARSIEQLVERERQRGIESQRIVIAGFSQGAAMALHCGLRTVEPLGGVIALSGFMVLAETLAAERTVAAAELPVFFGHGTQDPMVPMAGGRAAADRLASLGHPVEWHEYPMPHSVCAEEVRDIGLWLRSRLGPL